MEQINEDYVSFETAKLLKEKGFDYPTLRYYYDEDGDLLFSAWRVDDGKNGFVAPTLQMAMKWLREAHNWTIYISPYWPEGDMRNKPTWYYDIESLIDNRSFRKSSHTDNYEEACEAAIKYCLENLI